MFNKVAVFVLLVTACILAAKAQPCIPDPVENVFLDDATLNWEESNNCGDTDFIVNIHSGGILEYVYQVETPSLNVGFLSHCRTYTFTITAIFEHVIGLETRYETIIPLPSGTEITIGNFTGDQIDQDVLFQWHISPEHLYCVDAYKVLLWYQDVAVPEEIQTNQNGYYVLSVAQCEEFNLEISVQYQGVEHPVAKFNYTVPQATNEPSLVAVRQSPLTINTTWALESFSVNRCEVTALHFNGTRINATFPIHDEPARPTIDVSLPGLRADSMYYLNVTVENVAGISRPFQLAVQTLPLDPTMEQDFENLDLFDDVF